MRKLLYTLRGALVLAAIPVLTFLVCSACILGMLCLRLPYTKVRWLPHWWGKLINRLSGVTVLVEGGDNLKEGQPYIFAANHQSQFDIFVLQGYFKADFRWMAKKELFDIPIFGRSMKMAGYISVDRSHGRKAMQSLAEAAKRISKGTSVIIFPEGTRSPDGLLHSFKSGAMHLAIKAGVPVVPVAIVGTHQVLPKGHLLARPGTVTVRIGEPIDVSGYGPKQKQELAEMLHGRVKALFEKSNS